MIRPMLGAEEGISAVGLTVELLEMCDALMEMTDVMVHRPHFGLGAVEFGSRTSVTSDLGVVEPSSHLVTWVYME